jgi:hypothetical protein
VAVVDDTSVTEFRKSGRCRLVTRVVALVVAVAALVVYSVIRHHPWWLPFLLFGPIAIYSAALARWDRRHRPRLPLRLTPQGLTVTVADDSTLAIDWSNIARARVRGRWWQPRLLIEPVDPQQTRPPLKRWQWSGLQRRRPYHVNVPLDCMTPGPRVLREKLAIRLPDALR